MPGASTSAIKRFVLWDYRRASWQYDVMVAIILAFIFLTPREFFRDQPRGSDIVRLPSEQGRNVFWVEPKLLMSLPEAQRGPQVEQLLRSRYGKRQLVVQLEQIVGHEQEIEGFKAFTKP